MKNSNILWGSPQGEHILLNSKSELITLLNKIGVRDLEGMEAEFGVKVISRQMSDDELNESGIEYDPSAPEDSEIYLVDGIEVPCFEAPVFKPNMFMSEDELHLKKYPLASSMFFLLKEENVVLDPEIYKFPCVLYANIFEDYDRMGKIEGKIWHVTPLSEMKTVTDFGKMEEENLSIWRERMEDRDRFYAEREAYRKSKANQ